MVDLISRQAAIDSVCEYCEYYYNENVIQSIKEIPSAQPETAKRIVGKSKDGMTLWYQCDTCKEPVDAQDDFCRGCGRRLAECR